MIQLLKIYNLSIKTGEFPTAWKEAVVTPVHKKGVRDSLENYRPVRVLPAAAKLTEYKHCDFCYTKRFEKIRK